MDVLFFSLNVSVCAEALMVTDRIHSCCTQFGSCLESDSEHAALSIPRKSGQCDSQIIGAHSQSAVLKLQTTTTLMRRVNKDSTTTYLHLSVNRHPWSFADMEILFINVYLGHEHGLRGLRLLEKKTLLQCVPNHISMPTHLHGKSQLPKHGVSLIL